MCWLNSPCHSKPRSANVGATLLIAESIAAQILRDGGIHAIESTVLVTSNRQVFPEAERFDCKGNDGRLPIVSLEAVQSEFISSPGSWPEAMRRLCEQTTVTHQSVAQTEVIWAFGRLIANSDMHAGNLSFYLSEPPFALTPVYDVRRAAQNSEMCFANLRWFDLYVGKVHG